MIAGFLLRACARRLLRAAGPVLLGAVAAGPADAAGPWQRAAPGIGVLAPALPFPVALPKPVPAGELPGDDPYAEFGLPPAEAGGAKPARRWSLADFRYRRRGGPVQVVAHPAAAAPAWFGAVPGLSGVQRGAGFWQVRAASGLSWSVGNVTAAAPAWGYAVPMGGLQISEGAAAGAQLPEGAFGYSSTLGRVNHTPLSAGAGAAGVAGDLDYGPAAGSGSLRYGLTPSLTLESQIQAASALTTVGLGGAYSAGEWGRLQAAVTQGRLRASSGWRYALDYSVNVGDYVDLGYSNVVTGAGYGDLAGYAAGPAAGTQLSNTVTAGVPLGGLGTFSGTYTGIRVGSALSHERFGLRHSIAFAPDVRLALGADRDVVTGDYEMRMELTLPVDVFAGPLGFR